MNHSDKVKAIDFIRPNAEFVIIGDDIQWKDETQTEPTEVQIGQAWVAYQAKIETDKAEAAAKKAAAEAKLAALGLDADDLKALGL